MASEHVLRFCSNCGVILHHPETYVCNRCVGSVCLDIRGLFSDSIASVRSRIQKFGYWKQANLVHAINGLCFVINDVKAITASDNGYEIRINPETDLQYLHELLQRFDVHTYGIAQNYVEGKPKSLWVIIHLVRDNKEVFGG